MIFKARDLYDHLMLNGFVVKSHQEQNIQKGEDAEVVLDQNIVIQIGYDHKVEFGLTIEPRKQKRVNSDFYHVGYYNHIDSLVEALRKVCPEIETGTWCEVLTKVVSDKQEFRLKELYKMLENHPKLRSNNNYHAKIRQTVSKEPFINLGYGLYTIDMKRAMEMVNEPRKRKNKTTQPDTKNNKTSTEIKSVTTVSSKLDLSLFDIMITDMLVPT